MAQLRVAAAVLCLAVIAGCAPAGPAATITTSGGSHALVLRHDATTTVDAVSLTLDKVVPAVDQVLGTNGGLVVALVGTDRPELAGRAVPLVAAAVTDPRHGGHLAIDGPAYDVATETQREVLLAHEVVHLRLQPATNRQTPLWLVEGLADLVGYQVASVGLADVIGSDPMPGGLPLAADFDGDAAAAAYLRSWAVCSYLQSRLGMPGVLALFRTVAGSVDPGAELDAQLAGLGLTTAALASAVDGYLAAILG